MDEQVDFTVMGNKNESGEYDPETISFKFDHPAINRKLATWAKTRDLVQKTIDSRDEFKTEKAYKLEVADMQEKADIIKQGLMDDNRVVKKGTEGRVYQICNKPHSHRS